MSGRELAVWLGLILLVLVTLGPHLVNACA